MYPNPATVFPLPPRPQLDQYKKQAKDLLKACQSGDPDRIREWATHWIETLMRLQVPAIGPERRSWFESQRERLVDFVSRNLKKATVKKSLFVLADAQFIIARVHGFRSWPGFSEHIKALSSARISLFRNSNRL